MLKAEIYSKILGDNSLQNTRYMIEKPVFLVGAERSGTTLLRLMLKHHPHISWLKEFEYSVDLINEKNDYPSLNYYHEYLDNNRIFRSTGLKINKTLKYPELVNDFLEQQQKLDNKLLIGATVHRNFDQLLSVWSDARFIHIVRDPRDVARSCIGMGWVGNVWYGVDKWIEAEKMWIQMKTQISDDRYIEIRYEDLICEPEQNLTRICQFLGLTYDESMLSYDRNSSYGKPDRKLIYQWQKKLSESEIQLVETKVGDLLTKKQYQPSGLNKIEVDDWMKKKLSLQNWLYQVNYRIKKFGLTLFLMDYLSRKFGSKSWQRTIQLKMHVITNKNLK